MHLVNNNSNTTKTTNRVLLQMYYIELIYFYLICFKNNAYLLYILIPIVLDKHSNNVQL